MLPITLSLYGARPVTWTQNLPIIGRMLWPVELDEQIMVPRIGFEPMTNRIWVYCSTTELSRLIVKRTPSKNSSMLLYGQAKMLALRRYPHTIHLLYSAKVFNGTLYGTRTRAFTVKGWRVCHFTNRAYKAIFFPFAWLSVKFFIAKIPAHSDTVLSSERASYLRQRKANKRTNFLFYISQTFRTITSLAAVALRHTLIGIRVLVPTWYSIRESNSVLYLERVATQPICLMEYN